ncbi:MAG: GNAT family N-acetyltransferase [Planctomycetaceae bacterium]|nr:GNAT family N-acetyltransferase [Planctomycetaceae bacterium]
MQFRSFENSDTPLICDLWRQHSNLRGKYHGLNPAVFERVVLSKTYFDPQSVFLALENGAAVGLVHVAFGISENQQGLDYQKGVIAQLLLRGGDQPPEVATKLLEMGETYLREHGSSHVEFGGYFPLSPFYLGLYGGSRFVGMLADDQRVRLALGAAGYEAYGSVVINHWRLGDFRQVIDRQQLMISRSYVLENVSDSHPQTWLQACHYDAIAQKFFQLKEKRTGEVAGQIAFWEMDPLVENWGQNGVGLVELSVLPQFRRKGLATYMVGESLRQLKQGGFGLVEIQHLETDNVVKSLCKKLEFKPIDSTVLWRKDL